MTNTITKKRSVRIAEDQAMIDGTQKLLAQIATLLVGDANMAPADIVKVFQDRIDAAKAALAADAARASAVKEDRDTRAQTSAVVQAFRRLVLAMFKSPDKLALFGLKPPKAKVLKVATKAAAVAKNKATRAARGTVGPTKRKAIKAAAPAAPAVPADPQPPKA